MAVFDKALAYLDLDEGGYANNPADPGEETYRGISRKNWARWPGWQIVDSLRNDPTFPRALDQNAQLQDDVATFYRQNYWKFDGVSSQAVANQALDFAVNVGLAQGIKLLQKAARYVTGRAISVDGIYGPATEAAVNAADASKLLSELKTQAVLFYIQRNNVTFLTGWIRRACRVTAC